MVKVDLTGTSAFFDPAELDLRQPRRRTERSATSPAQAASSQAGWSFPNAYAMVS